MQGYSCQAAVDAKAQVIVAHSAVASSADSLVLVPMLTQIRANIGRNPEELSADRGYLSEANLEELKRRRFRGYIAVGRKKDAKKGTRKRGVPTGKLTREMAEKLRKDGHRSRYRLRKQVVEPPRKGDGLLEALCLANSRSGGVFTCELTSPTPR